MHAFEAHLGDGQPGQNDDTRQDDQRLQEVGADDCAQATQYRVEHTDGQNHAHADAVIDAGQGVDQHAAGHPHGHQPAESVEQGNGQKHPPGRLAVAQADKIPAGESGRHQTVNAFCQGSKQHQSDRPERIAQHAPHAHLQRQLRCGHGGVAGDPGGHGGGSAQRQADPASRQHVAFQSNCTAAQVAPQGNPDDRKYGQYQPACSGIQGGALHAVHVFTTAWISLIASSVFSTRA